jgi:predicted enzyme related to lactoylglutathione lyase
MAAGGPLVILFASDLEATLQRAQKAGAKIVKPIFAFPGGRRFHFADPDGYELAVWSDK